jgi:hypothetical protein
LVLQFFSYISLFAFWEQQTIMKIIGGVVVSSFFLTLLDALTNGISWSIQLAIPLLFAANFILIVLITIIHRAKFKGVNLFAFSFIAAALLCICTDAVLSYFKNHFLQLQWSIIVSALCHTGCRSVVFCSLQIKKRPESQQNFSYLKSRFSIWSIKTSDNWLH